MSYKQQAELEDIYTMHTFARKPVEFVRGSGMKLYDEDGKEYLDFIGGIGADCLGHCYPVVADAIANQAHKLIHVSNYYYIEGRGELSHTLSDMLNTASGSDEPWETFFANSGAEANECAIKLARLWSKKNGNGAQHVLTVDHSFHGRTLATLAATAQPAKQNAFQPLPAGFDHVPFNDAEALEHVFENYGDDICGLILEVVQGESGVHPFSREYLEAAQRLCHEHQALLICDEVQCGIYRCGTYPYAFQLFGIEPDVVTMAKGIAGGFPMGACAARAHVASAFAPGDHGSTFGGSNLAIAAANATLGELHALNVATSVSEVGTYLSEKLGALKGVTETRGFGLMIACDLAEGIDAPQIVSDGLLEGLVLNYTGPSTLRFLPPLICTKADIDVLIEKLGALLLKAQKA